MKNRKGVGIYQLISFIVYIGVFVGVAAVIVGLGGGSFGGWLGSNREAEDSSNGPSYYQTKCCRHVEMNAVLGDCTNEECEDDADCIAYVKEGSICYAPSSFGDICLNLETGEDSDVECNMDDLTCLEAGTGHGKVCTEYCGESGWTHPERTGIFVCCWREVEYAWQTEAECIGEELKGRGHCLACSVFCEGGEVNNEYECHCP